MAIDLAHTVLGGLTVAMGAGMFGKFLSNKQARERLDKLDMKLLEAVPAVFCTEKHKALNILLLEKFGNVNDKLDLVISKVDILNNR